MYAAQGKKILNTETKNKVDAAVRALKESPATSWYFEPDSPFNDSIQRFYQLKFKTNFRGTIYYRCMADLIIVDHKNKEIQPVDLKTSGHPEWEFPKSFIQWRYDIQSRLYWRIINEVIKANEDYKDYKVLPYKFIVVNKETLTPLVWDFEDTEKMGTLYYGKNKEIECTYPFELGEELSRYLQEQHKVPIGISTYDSNSIIEWL